MEVNAAEVAQPGRWSEIMPGSAFSYRGFQLYWAARLCAAMAIQMQAVAVGWQVYELTQRPLDLGLVGLAQFLPALGLALFTGQVADRYDRRRVLALCVVLELVCALLLLTLTAVGNANEARIFGIIFLFGVARAFEFPAAVALLSNLVPPHQFAAAAVWNSSAGQAATIIGPAVGGLLYAIGPGVVYGCCALLFIAAALLVSLVQRQEVAIVRKAVTWTSLVAGIAFIRAQPVILGAVSLDLFAVLLGGATAMLLAHKPITSYAGSVLLGTVGMFGIATIGFGLSHNLWLSLIMLAILGAADMVSVVIRRVLVQVSTPDPMRGRVSAVESVFIGASNELGEFESGVTAAWLGAVPAVVLGGVGTLAVVALWARLFPH